MQLQRSDEWFGQRLGRFTASRISDLMGVKGLGKTGETYAFDKAAEIVFGRDEAWDVETWDMKRGTETEPAAFELFKTLMAQKFIEVEETGFQPIGDNCGASADGLVGKTAVLEIKCPRPAKLFGLIKDGITGIDQVYIDQMQTQIAAWNAERAYFFSYAIWKGKELHHTIIVPRDDERIKLITDRVSEAVILRDRFVEELTQRKQF